MGPEFEVLASELEGLYKFAKVSIDDAEDAAVDYNVNAVPTILFVKEGKEVSRLTGFRTKDEIRDNMATAFN
jgi:thioredoxin 1